ncbi:DUF7344 domain-containing protein [Natranaeroarchaeum sulfidigenes]|uniref:Putative trancriptional regulator, ArsR family n=1 Tax=Natranaeroarchaeum sulfidigenes TaxID=2784880 RepID=A0A897MTI0_9EURY|nr:hypothetical protein [Natranaeroarchaeum sulfidigenes]QSG03834.1 putative trancriptional regulator, ArsR family [Natranaeroarchaeum sulfidigenes]
MNTDTRDDRQKPARSELSADVIFDLLSVTRRRHALYYISEQVGTVSLPDLSDALTVWEPVEEERHHQRIATGLYHRHLPKLADAGVLQYDADTDTIELLPAAEQLQPYLDLAAQDDARSA